MRKLFPAILMIACAGLWACGGDGDGEGDTGGGGTGGGQAGNGGEGGEGGEGGNGPKCGNDIVEEGEQCDDGNPYDGDGCSKDCIVEGTCELPLNFNQLAAPGSDNVRQYAGTFPTGDSTIKGSCGGDGPEVVFRYEPGMNGVLQLLSDGYIHVRKSSCDAAEEFGECLTPAQMQNKTWRMDVAEDDVLIIFVDSDLTSAGGNFVLLALLEPIYPPGELCDEDKGWCPDGYYCGLVEGQPRCIENSAPILESATVTKAGRVEADLRVSVTGSEPDKDASWVVFRFRDAAGEVLLAPSNDGPAEWVGLALDPKPGATFTRTLSANGYLAFPELADAETVDVALLDGARRQLWSNELNVPITNPPRVSEGELCDPDKIQNFCDVGAVCVGAAPDATCLNRGELQATACAEAPSVAINGSFYEGNLDANKVSLWDWQTGCGERIDLVGLAEQIVKVEVEEQMAELTFTTTVDGGFTKFNTLLYVLEGCEPNGELALGCIDDDDAGAGVVTSTLTLNDVAPGTYFVVVEQADLNGAGEFGLEVSGTPAN